MTTERMEIGYWSDAWESVEGSSHLVLGLAALITSPALQQVPGTQRDLLQLPHQD